MKNAMKKVLEFLAKNWFKLLFLASFLAIGIGIINQLSEIEGSLWSGFYDIEYKLKGIENAIEGIENRLRYF